MTPFLFLAPFLCLFWWVRTAKFILFYFYLWQLKEYHIGRFLDHFRTEKGKKLIFNRIVFLKIALLCYFLFFPYLFDYLKDLNLPEFSLLAFYFFFPSSALIIYLFEFLKTGKDLFKKQAKFPKPTKKIVFLVIFSLICETFMVFGIFSLDELNSFTFWLLTIDLLIPFIVSIIVLSFQPFAVIFRSQIIIMAKRKREKLKDLLVIGITGSYGKTSTKEFLYRILSKKFRVLKTSERQNSEIGISQCILNELTPEYDIFIVEMGAYGRRGIKLLCNIVKPHVGILTGINEQHLALFGSQKNIIRTKYELIESLPKDGLAIFNGSDKYCLELYDKTEKPKRIFTSQPRVLGIEPDVWAENIIVQKEFVFFRGCDKDGCDNFKAYLSGSHFVSNLLGAICVATELGMKKEEISQSVLDIDAPRRTMNIFKGLNDLIIIDDSYSANPQGVIAALDYLKIYDGKKLIVMPCLIELGLASREIHKSIGRKIGEICDAAIITTRDYFQEIREGAVEKGLKNEEILFSENPSEILNTIQTFFYSGDAILFAGRVPQKIIDNLIAK